jgi:hypothetical protein
MAVKVIDLFDAYSKDLLPKDQAYVVSSSVNPNTGYVIYEIISYSGVKAIYLEGDSLTFQSSGKKMHILIEPPSYPHKADEPYLRAKQDQIPLRFSELTLYTTKNQAKIYMAKKPIESLSSFSVAKPVGLNISYVFYKNDEIYETLTKFFEETYNKDARIPQIDAKKVAKETVAVVQELMAFKSDFGSQ